MDPNLDMKTPFLKEAYSNLKKNSVLVILNQKQLKPSINSTIKNLVEDKKNTIIISTQNYTKYFDKEIPKNIFIINVSSEEKSKQNKDQVYTITNPADLTGIQIATENFLKKINGEVTIFFDSVNSLAIHNSPKNIAKFFYIYINKTSLQNNSLLLFVVKDSINESALEKIKQFCGKIYDYSNIFVSSIEIDS